VLVKRQSSPGTPIRVAEYHGKFPSGSSSVGQARRAVVAFAQQWFSDDDLSDIESAVGEALANCVEHSNAAGSDVDLRCRFDGRELTVEIKDAGNGFDRWNARDFAKPPAAAPRGYGTYIMRRLMDEIEYTERGTRVRLVKRRLPAQVADNGRGERFA